MIRTQRTYNKELRRTFIKNSLCQGLQGTKIKTHDVKFVYLKEDQ